jgi:hypothetical protein
LNSHDRCADNENVLARHIEAEGVAMIVHYDEIFDGLPAGAWSQN